MGSAYYSNEEAVLKRETDVSIDAVGKTALEDIESVYEIERCVKYITEKRCRRVGLQFPDSLLIDASNVAKQLESRSSAKIYVLADTSYGHCDIDEVNASHVTADLIIHYGETSLNPSAKIPTIFVFGRHKTAINSSDVCRVFQQIFPSKEDTRIVLLHHVTCEYIAEKISDQLMPEYPYLSIGRLNIPTQPGGANNPNEDGEENVLKDLCTKSCPGCPCRLKEQDENGTPENSEKNGQKQSQKTKNGPKLANDAIVGDNSNESKNSEITAMEISNRESQDGVAEKPVETPHSMEEDNHEPDCKDYITGCYTIPLEVSKDLVDYSIFYVGPKDAESLKNLMTEHPLCVVHAYDPSGAKCERVIANTNRKLMKRYYLVEKAKDAKTVGIIAGTMGAAGYLECINYMKKIAKLAKKKTYTFIVGKLNPEKLANFMEIDIFVLVANPENSILDSSNFYRPIVTPFEFDVACNPNREWTGEYITDFRKILPGGSDYREFTADEEEQPTMSLVTGKVRTNEIEDWMGSNPTDTSLALRNEQTDLSVFDPNSAAHRLSERTWKGLEQKLGETPVTMATKGRSGVAISYNNEMDF